MKTIYEQIKSISQPIGGFINPKNVPYTILPTKDHIDDRESLETYEMLALIKLIFHYVDTKFSRYILEDQLKFFKNSKNTSLGKNIINNISELDNQDINNIYYLIQLKNIDMTVKDTSELSQLTEPDLYNIHIYIKRYTEFTSTLKKPIKHHIRYNNTPYIKSDVIELISQDSLWDFTLSRKNPTKNQFLSLLVQYVILSRTIGFNKIKTIGLFNPRTNILYTINTQTVDPDLIKICEKDLLGYKESRYELKNQNHSTYEAVYYKTKKTKNSNLKTKLKNILFYCILILIFYILLVIIGGTNTLNNLYNDGIKPVFETIINFLFIK